MTAAIEICAFGPPVLSLGGSDTGLRLRRGLAALAYLVEAARPVRRPALAELLWPDKAEGVARERLRRLIHRINRTATRRLILPAGYDSVALNSEMLKTYDVGRFRSAAHLALDTGALGDLEKACTFIGAPFLEGLDLSDCPELNAWAARLRMELESMIARVMRLRAERLAEAGETDAALFAAQALVTRDPLRESSHRLTIRLLLSIDDPEGARAQYEELKHWLKDGFDAEPSATTTSLLSSRGHGTPSFCGPLRHEPATARERAFVRTGAEKPVRSKEQVVGYSRYCDHDYGVVREEEMPNERFKGEGIR